MSPADTARRLARVVDDLLAAVPCSSLLRPRPEEDYARLVQLHGTARGLAAALGLPAPPPLEEARLAVHAPAAPGGPFVPVRAGYDRPPREWEQQLVSLRAAALAFLDAAAAGPPSNGAHVMGIDLAAVRAAAEELTHAIHDPEGCAIQIG